MNHEDWCSCPCSRMMLQHTGPSLADISCSALVPCLSPPGTLTLDDFTNFTPIVKEELRLAIQNKRLSSGLSADVSSDGASSSSDRPSEHLAAGMGGKREVRCQRFFPWFVCQVCCFGFFKGLKNWRLPLWYSDFFSGTGEEEEEEGEEQDRCCQVPQQEEGEDRVSAEGAFQLLSFCSVWSSGWQTCYMSH